jgi:hypothetical protein
MLSWGCDSGLQTLIGLSLKSDPDSSPLENPVGLVRLGGSSPTLPEGGFRVSAELFGLLAATRLEAVRVRFELAFDRVDVGADAAVLLRCRDLLGYPPGAVREQLLDLGGVVALLVLFLGDDAEALRLRVETEDQSLPGAKPAPADLREREPAAVTVELLEPQHRVRLAAPGAGDLVDGIVPDLVAVSKTLGGGVPLAATITNSLIEEDCVGKGFLHVTSHVSDPLPAAAGLAVLEVIEEERLVERAGEQGEYLLGRLRELQAAHEQIGDVRGRGLLVGLELVEDRESRRPADALGAAVTAECLRRGLSMNIVRAGSGANCFRMAPPLTISEDEIDLAVEILDSSLKAVLAERPELAHA